MRSVLPTLVPWKGIEAYEYGQPGHQPKANQIQAPPDVTKPLVASTRKV